MQGKNLTVSSFALTKPSIPSLPRPSIFGEVFGGIFDVSISLQFLKGGPGARISFRDVEGRLTWVSQRAAILPEAVSPDQSN